MATLSKTDNNTYRSSLQLINLLKCNWLLLLIFILVIFLRFYRLADLFYFGIDEEYQSLLGWAQVKNFHPIWIGLSAANTGYYVGPGLVYLHALLLWISRGDPLVLAYAASTIAVAALVVFYLAVKDLFDQKTALIAFGLYGLSAFVVQYDRRFWNSTPVPLAAVLIYWSLVKLQKDRRFLLLLAVLTGGIFHIHASLFLFIPLILYCVFQSFKSQDKIRKPSSIIHNSLFLLFTSFFLFALIYSPLAVYDLVHNFDNLKTPLRMFMQHPTNFPLSADLSDHIALYINTVTRFWIDQTPNRFFQSLIALLSTAAIFFLIFKKKTRAQRMLAAVIFLYLLLFLFFPGKMLDYYYLGFFPFFAIAVADLIQPVSEKLTVAAVAIICFNHLFAFFNWPTAGGLTAKKKFVIAATQQIANRSFYLETKKPYLYDGGWRYLFSVYGRKPSQSKADEMFGWIYPEEIGRAKPKIRVIISADQKGEYKAQIQDCQ